MTDDEKIANRENMAIQLGRTPYGIEITPL